MTDEITARHVAALGAFINALRALPEEFQSGCVHDTREHVKAAIKASLDDIPSLVAELAAARDREAAVRSERNRLAIIARQLMHGLTPKAEAERLIAAALSQSEPTKERSE